MNQNKTFEENKMSSAQPTIPPDDPKRSLTFALQSTALPPDSQLAVGCDAGTHMARIGFLMRTSEL
jgi:hypothetical protein